MALALCVCVCVHRQPLALRSGRTECSQTSPPPPPTPPATRKVSFLRTLTTLKRMKMMSLPMNTCLPMAFMESTFCSQWVNHLCVEGVFIDDFSLAWLVYCSIALCPGCLLSSLLKSCFLFCFLQTCCYQYIVWVLFQFGLVYVMKQKLCKCSHSFWLIDEKQTIVKNKLCWQRWNKVLSAQLGRMNLLPVYHQMVLSFSGLCQHETMKGPSIVLYCGYVFWSAVV